MGNTCSSCTHSSQEIIHRVEEKGISEVAQEKYQEVKEDIKEFAEDVKSGKVYDEVVHKVEEVYGTVKEAVVGAEVQAAATVEAVTTAVYTPPKQLSITFEAVTGKETEMTFKTNPLPFTCKPQAKGGCCASGTTGKVVIAKIDAAKAKEYYDLKVGMVIKKIDGVELLKDQDFQEFQKTLGDKTKELPEEAKEAPKEEYKKEEPKKEEAPKEEYKKEEPKQEEAPKEEYKEEAKEAYKEEAKEAPKEEYK